MRCSVCKHDIDCSKEIMSKTEEGEYICEECVDRYSDDEVFNETAEE